MISSSWNQLKIKGKVIEIMSYHQILYLWLFHELVDVWNIGRQNQSVKSVEYHSWSWYLKKKKWQLRPMLTLKCNLLTNGNSFIKVLLFVNSFKNWPFSPCSNQFHFILMLQIDLSPKNLSLMPIMPCVEDL